MVVLANLRSTALYLLYKKYKTLQIILITNTNDYFTIKHNEYKHSTLTVYGW